MNSSERKVFVESLAAENRAFYGTPDGRGTLRAFELTFEHRWIYVFELIQNAVDAGARSIALAVAGDGDALTIEHDGQSALDEKDVQGLSKIFRSTKGASSVGFMGIGFKSVFGRFREARISGWDWTFRYEVPQVVGPTYGDVQPDLLGAVTPIWDENIPAPSKGFSTRFELRGRVDREADLRSDLAHFLSEDDRTPLAILAAAGVQRLEVDGRVWELGVHQENDGSLEATALSQDEDLLWQLFPIRFEPSPEAIARFLEHRRIQPSEEERDRVYAEAGRVRQVLGVLPLDGGGVPVPPKRGRVYATLPTEVTLPFGLHINADWLLNISRTGLREIEDNPWQRDIVQRIADVLASFLHWVASTLSSPAAVRAAFAALAVPSRTGEGRLESLLAADVWLARLHSQLEDAAVLPVWTELPGALTFAKASEAINPPAPLAEAFEEEPTLLPPILMRGPVVARGVLGPGGGELLELAGLLVEMTPEDLEQAWANGLESWWGSLAGEESNRRDVLFRLWSAVAELASDEAWKAVQLPCVRTSGGEWLCVGAAAFFNEPLPSEREPGGSETRQLIESFLPDATSCLPDAWMGALRQASGREGEWGPLSQARAWLEREGRSIDLRDAVDEAMNSLASSPHLEWSVLVPFGHWVMHRRSRTDLLTHVLVESEAGPRGIPIADALVADPYVERGEGRRRLLPSSPAISAKYVEEDPSGTDAHEWRVLFEKAGAQGTLAVRPIETQISRYDRHGVSEFLGLDPDRIGESNDAGYVLMDFEIMPQLPAPSASEEIRAALAPWLEDGFSALRGQGRRKATYSYYGRHNVVGERPSCWLAMLAELAWVPCDDSRLRVPRDVLPRPDPAREGLPVARMSSDLLSALEQEGLEFGSAIPEAPALRRLLALGPRLGAEDLADLLREIRETGIDEDRGHLAQALQQLTVPSKDGSRFPLNRAVQRVGGRLRGTLGGWILPLGDIAESLRAEVMHPDFPYEFPDTTTGGQALAFLREVWKRAGSASEGLANEVRDVLPAAYAYCLEDSTSDESLSQRWQEVVHEAVVFAEREWVQLSEARATVYFDDLEDRRFFPSQAQLRTATGGHLGNSLAQQTRTATALGLSCMSSVVELEWNESGAKDATSWVPRFDLICELLAQVRGTDRTEGRDEADPEPSLALRRVEKLELIVGIDDSPAERVPVNARLKQGVLIVAGKPVQFASDAAKELLRGFGFRQRGDLAADLTGMLGAIDEVSDFMLAVDKFSRSFAPHFHVPDEFRIVPSTGEAPVDDAQLPESGEVSAGAIKTEPEEAADPDTGGGSFDRDRALAQQKALTERLKKILKGELEPGDEEEVSEQGEKLGDEPSGELGDEVYREIAAQYERLCGREPDLGDPHQTGWDLRSIDLATGSERLIEVKGKGCPWREDEVIELSRAQVRKAFEALGGDTACTWYLYVVERIGARSFEVLPIANPAHLAGKWILRGEAWRMVADEPRQITMAPAGRDASEE